MRTDLSSGVPVGFKIPVIVNGESLCSEKSALAIPCEIIILLFMLYPSDLATFEPITASYVFENAPPFEKCRVLPLPYL